MDKEIVTNEFPPVYDERSRVLILGSLPSVASRAAGFYYMNPRNRFWMVLSALLGEDYVAMTAEQKADALKRSGIALSDVVLSCEIHRSSDASIQQVTYTDVPDILAHTKVKAIFLNGGKAYELFSRRYPEYTSIAKKLPSTSPANAREREIDLVKAWSEALLPWLRQRSE